MSRSQPQPTYITPPKEDTPDYAKNPFNEYFYQDGTLRSSRTKTSPDTFRTQTFSTPDEKRLQSQATGFISGLVPQLNQQFGNIPRAQERLKQSFMDPQVRALNESYNQARGQNNLGANARGMRGSIGHSYLQGQIEKNRAQGMADIAANAEMQSYDLPSKMIAPYADIFNIYNAALSGEQSRGFQSVEPTLQGAGIGANIYNNAAARYAPQLYQPPQRQSFFGLF